MELLSRRPGPRPARRRGWPFRGAWILALGLGFAASRAPAQPVVAPEYQLKAVFLYHFAQFIQWPPTAFADAQAPLIIGVLGKDPFGAALDQTVSGETVDRHPVRVQRFDRVEEVEACHILFISRTSAAELDHILRTLRGRSILTVGDADGFARAGGMIGFVTEDNRIRFRINLRAARAAHLILSSNLLRPAEIVAAED